MTIKQAEENRKIRALAGALYQHCLNSGFTDTGSGSCDIHGIKSFIDDMDDLLSDDLPLDDDDRDAFFKIGDSMERLYLRKMEEA